MIVIRRFSLLQLLVKNFTIDSITVKPLQTTYAPGVDYMADYDEWLFIQVSIYISRVAGKRGRRRWPVVAARQGGNFVQMSS